ncbi:serine hydrolase domain-containing protein [Agromyces ramosus]|uniref:D-alanyl-D-alanine carboxypeptidase n=1 Tax=Agromyces ramosus TaxID=33879 RepID=A0ABU0R649_9MICO|nr:serine hydrolase domain-containing protein [Agromyces ramosus]MDQ0893545.1 D-alanyl-D-alanine carboxypeptidase [Agromyces ramosus]
MGAAPGTRDRRARTRTRIGAGASVVAVVVALVAGCADTATDAPTAAPIAAPTAGTSLESIVLPVLTEQMEELQVPGLVAIVEAPGGERYEVALGVADVETGEPMEVTDHLRVGSIMKTMTATVILQLAEEGKLGLDDQLSLHFPDLDTNGATIRQALNMTSGIPTYTDDVFMEGQAADPHRVWTPEEVLAIVAGRPATFAPGEGWEYSNTNYTMLGLIAERAGGAPLGELIDERIFTPLGMSGCSAPAQDTTMPDPRSHGYQWGAFWNGEGAAPPIVDVTDWNVSWGFGAGEAICTAPDMLIWAHALFSGELLEAAMQADRLEWVSTGHPSLEYGLGIADLSGVIGHNGATPGFQSQAGVRQSDGTAIIVLTNLALSPEVRPPASTISNAISEALPPQ